MTAIIIVAVVVVLAVVAGIGIFMYKQKSGERPKQKQCLFPAIWEDAFIAKLNISLHNENFYNQQ